MVANIHFRWDFIGLSTDSKPTASTSPKVVDGSTYYEADTSKLYVWYNNQWYEKTGIGGNLSDKVDKSSFVYDSTTQTLTITIE